MKIDKTSLKDLKMIHCERSKNQEIKKSLREGWNEGRISGYFGLEESQRIQQHHEKYIKDDKVIVVDLGEIEANKHVVFKSPGREVPNYYANKQSN